MKYIFFGQPNQLVKTRKRVPFEERIDFKPLFRFDSNGEYVTEDERLIAKLKCRFDHKEILDEAESVLTKENKEDEDLYSEEKIEATKMFKCKQCEFVTDSNGKLLAHYRKHKGGN